MPLQFDLGYYRSFLGAAYVVQFLLGILVLICIGVAELEALGKGFVYFVAVGSLVTSLVFLILYVIHLPDTGPFAKIPWNVVICVFLGFWTIAYLISGIMTAAWSSKYSVYVGNTHSSYGAASFFCFLATLLYGVCAYVYYRRWRVQPGTSVTVTERHTTTTTATAARY